MQRDIEAQSCNHCCRGIALSIIYSEFLLGALGIEHAMRMRHIVNGGLSRLYSTFLHYLTNGTTFENELLNVKCVLIFSGTF